MVIKNKEHIEAHLENNEKLKKEFFSTLSDEWKSQYEAVEKAEQILCDVGVKYYLFPWLKNPYNLNVGCFNSFRKNMSFDDNGDLDENFKKEHSMFFASMIHVLFDFHCGEKFAPNTNINLLFENFMQMVVYSITQNQNRISNDSNNS